MRKESEMMELVVREVCEGEDAVRREIVSVATRELRCTYRPRENRSLCGAGQSEVLVALAQSGVVGTAEYIRQELHIYVQGIAVHQEHRLRGVCRALLRQVEEIAKVEMYRTIALCAIEETGNVKIFKSLGFEVVSRATAQGYISTSGGQVTQVDMGKDIA